jgi:hypothetical protein
MRHAAYISILIGLWLFGMAGLMLGMDSVLNPPFIPHALFGGAYWAALCSVALAEEAAEWIRGNGTGRVPCRWEGRC